MPKRYETKYVRFDPPVELDVAQSQAPVPGMRAECVVTQYLLTPCSRIVLLAPRNPWR